MIDNLEMEIKYGRPPIRVGIIGSGRVAVHVHLPVLKKLVGAFKVVAICDVSKEHRDWAVEGFSGVKMYRRIDDALDDPDVELFDITVPTLLHTKTALSALNRRRRVVLETPMALSAEDANILVAAGNKEHLELFVHEPSLFEPDFLLAKAAMKSSLLGEIFEVRIRKQTYHRRNDWQSLKKCGGGALNYAGSSVALQALRFLGHSPVQIWSELKRIVSVGDAEDFAHIVFKGRNQVTVDIEICSGQLPPVEPSFMVRGSLGSFSVMPGATTGTFRVVDPEYVFPRKRSSVAMPPLDLKQEEVPVIERTLEVSGEDVIGGEERFWRAVYATITKNVEFPIALSECAETVRYLSLIKKASPYAFL